MGEFNNQQWLLFQTFNQVRTPMGGLRVSKRPISSENPIGSLAAGPQQFTILADTDHASADIPRTVAENIPQMARAGIKHIMLESYINPVGNPHRDSFDVGRESILKRLFQHPPQITDDEVRRKSYFFETVNAKDPKVQKEIGRHYPEILISARRHGIRVHFAGDDLGFAESESCKQIEVAREHYLGRHKKLNTYYERWLNETDFLQKLNWPESEKRALESRMMRHGNTLTDYHNMWMKADKKREDARMSPEAEAGRADRFVALANGEKAVVLFGAGHMNKKNDLNEQIDKKIWEKALERGQTANYTPTKVLEIWDSREACVSYNANNSRPKQAEGRPDVILYVRDTETEVTLKGQNDLYLAKTGDNRMSLQITPK